MKRILALCILLLATLAAFPKTASAATIYGKVDNLTPYNKGAIVCGVPYSYADSFIPLISGTSATDQRVALSILQFLQDNRINRCSDVRPDGNFNLRLPDEKFYVVIIALSTDSHVYWYVEQVDASIEQVIAITAPSF
jgi:hypothetical protein